MTGTLHWPHEVYGVFFALLGDPVLVRAVAMRFSDLGGPLVSEIKQEMAASYFAACKKMVDCLEALKAFDHTHASAALSRAQLARRSKLLHEAAERVHFVVIQREALQLSGADQFFQDYGISEEVKKHLGPRRQK